MAILRHSHTTPKAFCSMRGPASRSQGHSRIGVSVVKASANENEAAPALTADWRSVRAKLVAGTAGSGAATEENLQIMKQQDPLMAAEAMWAHPLSMPEQGGLVIASTAGQSRLPAEHWQAVVLLLQQNASGSVGVVLNRPTQLTMGRLYSIEPDIRLNFYGSRLYYGGPHDQQTVLTVHGFNSPQSGEEVIPGLYVTSKLSSAVALVTAGRPSGPFKFFAGHLSWGPGQLEAEVGQGLWHCAASSRPLALKHCLALPVPLWVETLSLMGGVYAEEAAREFGRPYEEGS